ncbi:ABC transporter substrate-binding protein [Clostridium sp. BNL1100]|uniref:ABC transporter substrate-binding protein n=1 Tax=Clostridium sp. BNL1100 TaxID=755731 RepID=UPI00024A7885|nr:ABC transporter substrate-binding protein [Clostridium sp. BNL1100]AEY67869.1 ABC-type sugar transport system, periplasmic component [Clostridium sp. BNL1100]
MIKNRIAPLVLSLAMLATAFTACGSQDSSNDTGSNSSASSTAAGTTSAAKDIKGEILFYNTRTDMELDSYEKNWKYYIGEFNKKYPNIKVNIETSKDYEGDLAIRMNSNEYGDVLFMSAKMKDADLPSFFIPLGKKAELEKKYDFVQDRYVGEDTYGIPPNGNGQGIVYNKSVFTKAGITTLPKTEDEFLADLKLIKDKTDAIPLYTNYKDSWALNAWEGYIDSVSGSDTYTNQVMLHEDDPFAKGKPHYIVYKYLFDVVSQKLVEDDPMTTDWESSKQLLADGKIATMPLGSWAIPQIKSKAKNPDDVSYMPFPYSIDGKMYTQAAGDYKLCISKNSKNIEAAKAFLWWFLDESNYAQNEGLIPSLKGSAYPDTLKNFQDMGVTLLIDKGAINDGTKNENGWLDAIDKESEVGLWNENFKKDIVDTALGNKKGTYDDIMNGLNKKWADTRAKLIKEGTIGK